MLSLTMKLISVFKDSMSIIKSNEELKSLAKKSRTSTQVYNICKDISASTYIKKSNGQTSEGNISVISGTSFDTARSLCEKYPNKNVAVLNFANAFVPGGGVKIGCTAQEECLCRCSTLYPSLVKVAKTEDFYKYHSERLEEDKYDINQTGLIYTPGVVIFKNDNYDMLEKWETVDVITAAAPNLRNIIGIISKYGESEKKAFLKKLEMVFEEKIKAILEISIKNDVDILVLGAFGCGAFLNPPKLVAEQFRKVLNTKVNDEISYKDCFAEIVFAIRTSYNGENVNYDTFKKVDWNG